MTEAELLAAVAEAQKGDPEAMTFRELRKMTGLGERGLKRVLHDLEDAGRLVVCFVQRTDIAGRPQTVPAYKLAPKKRKG